MRFIIYLHVLCVWEGSREVDGRRMKKKENRKKEIGSGTWEHGEKR